ncbi:Hypothetical protein PHPALM_37300 [Phytophthora palmivora]|uniref:Uncharacterized protein n=1 Tax=Phytophthora palmivora TaxID=4796 RepID=A0A2P4WXT1_9STRA|nr:Hypothetical protein PHPALM_37300 [Phytophthora palmivora]
MEHKRLTATAKSQASYIENLREICLVPHGVSTAAFQHDALTDVANGDKTPEFSDMALFESLLHKIDSCYASIDDLLGECGLAELPVGVVTSTHQRDEGGETEFIQHLNKFELPSSFEKTCLPSWKSVDRQHHQHDRKTYKYGSPNDTIAIRYRMVRTLATGTTASVVQRMTELCVFGKRTQRAREFCAGCILMKQDGAGFGQQIMDLDHKSRLVSVKFQFFSTPLSQLLVVFINFSRIELMKMREKLLVHFAIYYSRIC